jgi:MFS family permease
LARVAVDLTVLRESRDLRLLTLGQACSSLGTQAALVAIPYQVFSLTRSAALVGLVGAVELGPLIAGSLLGGGWADRTDRRRVLIAAQAAVIAVAGGLTAATLLGRPPVALVFVLAGALAGCAAVVNVTRSAAVPALAGERLRPALALNFGVAQVAAVVGPGLGGLVIAALGVGAVYAADTAGFAAMLVATAAMRPLPPPPARREPLRRSIADGLRFVRGNRTLIGSFAIDLAAMTFGMPRALFAVLSLTVLHAGASGTGVLYASVSVGATVAALTTGWLDAARRLGRITIAAVLAWGVAIAAAGLMPSLWPAAGLLALAGAADSVSAVCRTTINQTATPEAMRGRMSSVFMLVVTSGPRLGDVEAGVVASAVSAQFAVCLRRPGLRGRRRRDRAGVPGVERVRQPRRYSRVRCACSCASSATSPPSGWRPSCSPASATAARPARCCWPRSR